MWRLLDETESGGARWGERRDVPLRRDLPKKRKVSRVKMNWNCKIPLEVVHSVITTMGPFMERQWETQKANTHTHTPYICHFFTQFIFSHTHMTYRHVLLWCGDQIIQDHPLTTFIECEQTDTKHFLFSPLSFCSFVLFSSIPFVCQQPGATGVGGGRGVLWMVSKNTCTHEATYTTPPISPSLSPPPSPLPLPPPNFSSSLAILTSEEREGKKEGPHTNVGDQR